MCPFPGEQVHHFAFSLNPDYLYEQGRYGDAVVRVLYQPSDRATWGRGKPSRTRSWRLRGSTRCSGSISGPSSPTCTASRAAGPNSR